LAAITHFGALVHCVNFTPLRAFWFFRIVHGGG